MKVLIAGGGGFIGSHLAVALVEAGYETIIYDNFLRFGEEKLRSIMDKVTVVRGDVKGPGQIVNEVSRCDLVVHLAATSRVDASIASPLPTFEINVVGTQNVLECCRKFGAKLIFASSWMVYDREEAAKGKPLSENAKVGPITPYGLSKLAGEQYCKLFHSLYKVPTIILRFSNVYGPGDKERLVPTLISKAKKGDEIHIFGNEQTLNFIYVTDVARAICLALSTNIDTDTFNIGTQRSINLLELVNLVKSMCDSTSKVVVDLSRLFDYKYFQPAVGKAKKILGFQPVIDLKEGTKECIKYY